MYGFNYQQPPQIIGSLARAASFAEVQAAPVNASGAPTLFLLENSPEIYIVSLQGGQKSMQGFRIVPMPTAQEATESRLNNLEAALLDIKTMLKGQVKNNESDTASAQLPQSTAPTAANTAV